MRTALRLSLLSAASLVLVACAGTTSPEEAVGDDDVVGIQDLTAVEKELRLVKDTKDAAGQRKRSEAQLEAGPCYKATKGGANPGSYEFRRYVQGAAFFRKEGSAPGTGEDRPVVCLDLDGVRDAEGRLFTAKVGRFELDAMVRYHLGRELRVGGADDSSHPEVAMSFNFDRGIFRVAGAGLRPGETDTLDTPVFRGRKLVELVVDPSEEGGALVTAPLARLVYAFAWNSAKEADLFTLTDDPVGKFVTTNFEGAGEAKVTEHAQYEHLDAYRITALPRAGLPGSEKLFIAPKLAEGHLEDRAVVSCTRAIDRSGAALTRFECTGL
jgi:hypothetical protein